jgi:hypothetical protein
VWSWSGRRGDLRGKRGFCTKVFFFLSGSSVVYVSDRVGADVGGFALVDIVVGVSVLRELYLVRWWCSKVVFVTDVVVRKIGSGSRMFVVQLVSGSCLVLDPIRFLEIHQKELVTLP